MIAAALRSAIEKIPTREERLGGQTFKYVKLSEVLDLLDTFRSSNAHETCEQLTSVEKLLVEWWSTDMDDAELFNRAVRLSSPLATAMNTLQEKTP